mmetsp:Transcript_97329/g.251637  ORF Transcript_97329/g.251637 Transcript_97329/m.251637 type:complete len:203 (+) Transcript_97329:409-1017(+)
MRRRRTPSAALRQPPRQQWPAARWPSLWQQWRVRGAIAVVPSGGGAHRGQSATLAPLMHRRSPSRTGPARTADPIRMKTRTRWPRRPPPLWSLQLRLRKKRRPSSRPKRSVAAVPLQREARKKTTKCSKGWTRPRASCLLVGRPSSRRPLQQRKKTKVGSTARASRACQWGLCGTRCSTRPKKRTLSSASRMSTRVVGACHL